MSALANFIQNFFLSLIIKLANLFVDVAQNGYDGFIDFVVSVIGMFPDGPALPSFASTQSGIVFTQFLSALNWLFPIDFMISMVAWLAQGYLLFIFISPIARLFKLVT